MAYLLDPVITGNYAPTVRPPAAVATTAPLLLATGFVAGAVIDGYTLTVGDRILIKNQTNAVENGTYFVQASGAPLRTQDMPIGMINTSVNVFVRHGTVNANTGWICTNTPAIIGTNSLVWTQFDAIATLSAVRGGTGTNALGGTNTLLYTTSTNNISSIPTTANGILVTGPSGIPAITTTLPSGLSLVDAILTDPRIPDSDASNFYTLQPSNLTNDINLLLPVASTDQTFTFNSLQQTLTNKNLVANNTNFIDGSDPTKIFKVDLSTMSTATTITVSPPAQSGTIATTQYVQEIVNGLIWKAACMAKTSALLSVTPAGSQTTKTLTNNTNGPISAATAFDNVVLSLNSRVLIDNVAFGGPNLSCGIYVVSNAGSAGTPWVLTRSADANISANVVTGMTTFIEDGVQFNNTSWTLITPGPIVLDTTALSFTQNGGLAALIAGNGLTKNGNTLNVGGSATIFAAPDTLFVNSSAVANQVLLSAGTVGNSAQYGAVPLSSAAAVSGTLPVGNGGSGVTSFTTNGVLYGGSTIQATAAANSSVLVTSAGGVPSLSTTLPSGLTLGNSFRVNDNNASQQYIIVGGTLTAGAAANSTIVLPADAGTAYTDTFTLNNLAQLLQNKTLINPRLQTNILDTNSAILLGTSLVASAVNYFAIANAVAASGPVLSANGTAINIDINIAPKGTGVVNFRGTATAPAQLRLFEQTNNGTMYVSLASPAFLVNNVTLTLPDTVGSSGQALITDGSGVLSFNTIDTQKSYDYCLYSGQAIISTTEFVNLAYFSWPKSVYSGYRNGLIIATHFPQDKTTGDLITQIVDAADVSIIYAILIQNASGVGVERWDKYPEADATLILQCARALDSTGPDPLVCGVQITFTN